MITTPLTLELVRGVAELESTGRGVRLHRLPAWVRTQFPDPQLLTMESQPAGSCLVFETTATRVELTCHPTRVVYRGADRPRGRIDVIMDDALIRQDVLTNGEVHLVDLQTGETTTLSGGTHTTVVSDLPPVDKKLELWLPHNESVELLALRSDAPVRTVEQQRQRWVHHGSSISQGSNAQGPSGTWPVVASRRGEVELRNLGLGGSALVDPFIARVIRDCPADLISIKLGINVVNLDAMRLRSFVPAVHGFLDTIRDGHPHTPLILVSPIFCGIHEHTPGPGTIDVDTLGTDHVRFRATGDSRDVATGRLTLSAIRSELAALVQRRSSDPSLHYLDGTALYGPADAIGLPLPDRLHPDTTTHRLIGERFAAYAFGPDGPAACKRRAE